MRRVAFRASYIAVPVLAILAFLFVHRQMDGIAPAPPTAVPSSRTEPKNAGPVEQQPTVLAPEDAESLPPTATRNTTWSETPVLQSSFDGAKRGPSMLPTVRTAQSTDFSKKTEPL